MASTAIKKPPPKTKKPTRKKSAQEVTIIGKPNTSDDTIIAGNKCAYCKKELKTAPAALLIEVDKIVSIGFGATTQRIRVPFCSTDCAIAKAIEVSVNNNT